MMREIIIGTDENYQFSSGRLYSIAIYEYFGDGKVEKSHEEYIDDCVGFFNDIKEEIGIIWTDYNNRFTELFVNYLHEKGIASMFCYPVYKYIKEDNFRKRFVTYWIETKP